MKFLLALLSLSSLNVLADGFICYEPTHDVTVKVYNKTSPEDGTRNSSVMIFSDNKVQAGRKTIATFKASKRTLGQNGASFMGQVDLRVNETARAGENFLSTKLGLVHRVFLDVDFQYNEPVRHGDIMPGSLVIVKRNGEERSFDLECERYLKN
jgi:hypothetical protein